jgi:hypothetical protein
MSVTNERKLSSDIPERWPRGVTYDPAVSDDEARREDAEPAILIGAVLGDSDAQSMAWSRAIGTLSQRVERLSAGLATSVRINVVYHVAGKLAPNEFDGVRTGRFDKAQSLLVVQAAVPKRAPEEPEALLVELLDAALLAAEAWGRRRGIAVDFSAMRNLVRQVAQGDG